MFLLLVSSIGVFLILLLIVWFRNVAARRRVKRETVSLLVVAGSGGHTCEMLGLVESLVKRNPRYSPRIYVVSKTDVTSENRIHSLEKKFEEAWQNGQAPRKSPTTKQEYCVLRIPRSREVKQSWLSTVVTTAYSIAFSLPLVFQRKPDVILCNGPGTCVPICLVAFVFRVLGLTDTELVYVESICRVDDLSLSGKILYRIVNHFVVQWPELCLKYERARYLGLLS